MNCFRVPSFVVTCIIVFWSFGTVFVGPVDAQSSNNAYAPEHHDSFLDECAAVDKMEKRKCGISQPYVEKIPLTDWENQQTMKRLRCEETAQKKFDTCYFNVSKAKKKYDRDACIKGCSDDLDNWKSEAKCKLLDEVDGSCTPRLVKGYNNCVKWKCDAATEAKEVVQPLPREFVKPAQPVIVQPPQPKETRADKKEIVGEMTCAKNCETKLNNDRAAECVLRTDEHGVRNDTTDSPGLLGCNHWYDTSIAECKTNECGAGRASATIDSAAKCVTQPQHIAMCARIRRVEADTMGAQLREKECLKRTEARRAQCMKGS